MKPARNEIYGISPLAGALKDIRVMEEVKKINREISKTFRVPDDLLGIRLGRQKSKEIDA